MVMVIVDRADLALFHCAAVLLIVIVVATGIVAPIGTGIAMTCAYLLAHPSLQ